MGKGCLVPNKISVMKYGEKPTRIFEGGDGPLQVLWCLLGPYKKKRSFHRQITVLYGPSSPQKFPACHEHIAVEHPFRTPEINSLVASMMLMRKGKVLTSCNTSSNHL